MCTGEGRGNAYWCLESALTHDVDVGAKQNRLRTRARTGWHRMEECGRVH